MYGEQSILDPFFMALYGGTALLTLVAALYLLAGGGHRRLRGLLRLRRQALRPLAA